ncbi:hypothetical protein PENTCL1PPCAC_22271, partial [Pristionchus entomophagus]
SSSGLLTTRNIIRIGFPFASHPRIFQDEQGKWSGIHVDLWKMIGQAMGSTVEFTFPDYQHFGPDEPEVDGRFVTGVLGLLQNDSIDAAIGDYNLQKGRMGNFQYTPQYDYQPMNLIRRERVIIPTFFMRVGEFIGSFGGLALVITINMLVAALCTIFLKFYPEDLRAETKTYGIRFCIVFNIFVAFTLFNATFAGSNLVTSVEIHKEVLSETIHQLTNDNATLIVRDISHLLGYAN